jgi:DNA-binding PadR family transcriptional regulator
MVVGMASRPLQEPAFLILSALAREPLHGYGIAQDVEASSDGRITLRAGTLYGAIDRLVAAGLVEVDREEVVDSRLRRYYRLTPEGGSRLAAEAERAAAQARRALERLASRTSRQPWGGTDVAPGRLDGGTPPTVTLDKRRVVPKWGPAQDVDLPEDPLGYQTGPSTEVSGDFPAPMSSTTAKQNRVS